MIEVKITGISELNRFFTDYPATIKRAAKSSLSSVGYEFVRIAKMYGRQKIEAGLGWQPLSPYTATLRKIHRKSPSGASSKFLTAYQRYKRTWRNYEWSGKRGTGKRLRHNVNVALPGMPMGRLISALRYKVDVESGTVRFGFIRELGAKVEQFAELSAKGFNISITPKMRRLFFALHLPLRKGSNRLAVPARPFIGRLWIKHERQMLELFRYKFYENLDRYEANAK